MLPALTSTGYSWWQTTTRWTKHGWHRQLSRIPQRGKTVRGDYTTIYDSHFNTSQYILSHLDHNYFHDTFYWSLFRKNRIVKNCQPISTNQLCFNWHAVETSLRIFHSHQFWVQTDLTSALARLPKGVLQMVWAAALQKYVLRACGFCHRINISFCYRQLKFQTDIVAFLVNILWHRKFTAVVQLKTYRAYSFSAKKYGLRKITKISKMGENVTTKSDLVAQWTPKNAIFMGLTLVLKKNDTIVDKNSQMST